MLRLVRSLVASFGFRHSFGFGHSCFVISQSLAPRGAATVQRSRPVRNSSPSYLHPTTGPLEFLLLIYARKKRKREHEEQQTPGSSNHEVEEHFFFLSPRRRRGERTACLPRRLRR